jgi:prefoldin beta subunit
MDVSKETEQKIGQLQLLEQNMQNFLMQKQNFQAQLMEVENALKELESAKKETYKIVGNIMVASDKAGLKKDLSSKKEILDLRLKNLKKQEDSLKEKAEKIQAEVIEKLNKEKK